MTLRSRLPGSTRIYLLLCPVASRAMSQQWWTCCLYRHVQTLRFLPGCIRAKTFHCSVSSVLKQ